MVDDGSIERRSLEVGKWVNLLMAVAGVVAASLSRSDALLVDGLYSGVNFFSAIVAARVGEAVTRPPDRSRPFGYEAEESLYVTFRSLVLLGIIAFAAFSAAEKVLTYATGGEVPELVFGPILVYVAAMVVLCLGLAAWHRHNWRRTGSTSAILRTESRAAIVDGAISAGAGAALLGIPLLRGTSLAVVIPVADALVVLVLSLVIIREPFRMFLRALREAAGGAADTGHINRLRQRIRQQLEPQPFTLLDLAVTRLGRSHIVAAYVRPERPVSAGEVDALRDELEAAARAEGIPSRVAVIVSEQHPFD